MNESILAMKFSSIYIF